MNRPNSLKIHGLFSCFIIFFFLLFTYTLSADAHSSLKKTFPKGGEVLEQAPKTVEVWFEDPVVTHNNSIRIMDSKGKQVPVSSLDSAGAGHVITNLNEELESGTYMVQINVIAQDGYVIEEDFRFTVEEATKSEYKEIKLLKSNVSDGEIYEESPEQLELWFNQVVELTAIGIFNDNHQPVQLKEAQIDSSNPRHIIIPLAEKLSSGTYQITWNASLRNQDTSSFLRSNMGVYYFAVKEFSSMAINNGNNVEWNISSLSFGLNQIAYWFTFIGLTALFGITWFQTIILKKRVEQQILNKINLTFYLFSVLGLILLIIHHKLDFTELSIKEFISIKFSWVPMVQLTLITIGFWIKNMRLFFFGSALLLWPFIIGHASYPSYGGYITIVAASIHVLAVGIWVGGLWALVAKPKHLDSKEWFRTAGPCFSKWALISIVLIGFSGIWMTIQFLPSFSIESLIESKWGMSLVAKNLLFLLLIYLGYLQRKKVKNFSIKVAGSFLKRARTEVIYGVILLFFAATLVAANPSAAEQGVYKENTKQSDLDVNVEITPLEMGLNTITLDFEKAPEIHQVKVEMTMPPLWSIENKAFKINHDTYKMTGNLLHAAGTTHMNVKIMLESGKKIEIPYKIVVPGEVRFNE
ncbi:copper transport protein [Thalassobacillus cyri]|uniref:Copper transport protein n=1 Tax=Thalassobacillus cyri TaxID=571932 RepID=A0A1H4G7S3_9BACI|nr:copper resistance protein CopC [Thalassobacillus cyri]SEB05497.1 copper transport protein [Thalassobacillus cyri]